jgi:hypothetical protein
MVLRHMLTWVRSPCSLRNFETIKDCIILLVYYMLLLKGRLTQASDFFPGEGGQKKK